MSHSRLFGTDGIRAPFGTPPLDRRTISALAHALGPRLRAGGNGAPPRVVLGGDPTAEPGAALRFRAGAHWPSQVSPIGV